MTCLIDDGMKAAHGPALWTYNNAVFSDDDLKNIVKLSGATKDNQTSKIGRFGLGFNAVYNITDVPSFISRQFIAIFDPHTTHLGRAIMDKTKPGIKLDLQKNSKKIKKLSNQFKPFQGVFGCDTTTRNQYNGTLFRFPLRTREQSRVSDISDKHYSHEEFIRLLTLLAQSAESVLLFTQNILKVTVYHLDRNAKDGSEAKPLFTIKRRLIETFREISPKPVLSEVAARCHENEQRLLHQTNILNATSTFRCDSIQSSILMEVQVESTRAAIDLSIVQTTGKRDHQWAISSSSGTDVALDQASKDPSRLVAVGGVAIPVQMQGTTLHIQPASEGTTYCFLPLPITTPGLPVNINGYFAVHSSRRFLHESTTDDIDDRRGLWNEALAADPICKAYLNLLQDMTTKISPSEFSLLKMLPNMKLNQADPVPRKLTQQLLQSIIRTPVKLFSNGKKYAFFSQILYLEPEFKASAIGNLAHKVFCQLSQAVIVDMPKQLIDIFQDEIVGCRKEVQDKMYDKRRFYAEIFLPAIQFVDSSERNDLICDALRDGSLDDILKEKACIPVTPSGELKKASELIHPESKAAKLYVEEESRFPMLFEADLLRALERLGMRSEIPWEEVQERAESVSQLDETRALTRCQALVEYMQYKLRSRYPGQDECPDSIRDRIRTTSFLPPMKQPSHITLPWKESDAALLAPEDLYLEDRKMLVCAVCPLVEKSIVSSEYSHIEVATFLGLRGKTVTSHQLINQLIAIKILVEHCAQSNTSLSRHSDIETSVRAVYDELQKICLKDNSFGDIFAEIFQNEPLIYFDGSFRSVNGCAFQHVHAHGNCEPQLFTIPRSDAYKFRQLFSTVGVKDSFTCNDYVEALQRMKEKFGNEPLTKDQLQLAVNLLTYTCASVERENIEIEKENLPEKVFIPDTDGILQRCSEMSFNNCPWIDTSDELKLTHGTVAHELAKILHMKTIREDLLDRCSDDFGDDFSQKEKLTNRLRRILEGYPRDITILKELLQNADDAGATEIHFILDTRQHGTDKVFEDKWKPLQGPALCVYNNRPFTQSDLEGIKNLGEGSKGKDPNKTGQYGVGFNCVYNITDAPMFLTKGDEVGETLCIFDPQCSYIPARPNSVSTGKQLPRKPARDLESLRKQFPDVFSCFLEEMVNINDGTLFRFPLRESRSCLGERVTQVDIDQLFSQFQQELSECLIFLANLRQVKLSKIDLSGRCKEIYSVQSRHSQQEDYQNHQQFVQHLTSIGRNLRSREVNIDKVDSQHTLYSVEIEDSKGLCRKYRVGQQIGWGPGHDVPQNVLDAYRDGNLALLPRGGIAILIEHTSKKVTKKACKSRMCCFLPLPLEPKLPDGIHINGHFALDYESRRALWQPDIPSYKSHWNTCIMEGVLAPLYVNLLVDQRPGQQEFTQEGTPNEKQTKHCLQQYEKLFLDSMVRKQENLYLDVLHDTVYRILAKNEVAVFPVLRPDDPIPEWLTVTQSHFNDLFLSNILKKTSSPLNMIGTFLMTPLDNSPAPFKLVEEVLLKAGFNLLFSSLRIMNSFRSAFEKIEASLSPAEGQPNKIYVKGVSPKAVIEFFKQDQLKSRLPRHITKTYMVSINHLEWLMKFCQEYEGFPKEMFGLPFLVTNDEFLRVISSENPVFLTYYTSLVSNKPERFVHSILYSYFKSLKVLGNPTYGFQAFTTEHLADMFTDDPQCEPLTHGEVSYRRESRHEEWLQKLWKYLSEEANSALNGRLNAPGSDYSEEDRQQLDILLAPLFNWSIFPVKRQSTTYVQGKTYLQGTTYLRPLKKATSALDLDAVNENMKTIFEKLQLPIPDYSVLYRGQFDSDSVALAKRLAASSAHAYSIILCLQDHMESHKMAPLQRDDARKLLQYFADNIESLRDAKNVACLVLQKLPYFETVFHDLISIAGTHTYVVPTSIPTADMDVWKRSYSGNVFLRSYGSLKELYCYLGCLAKTEVEIYCEFILEQAHFDLMTERGRMTHLKYIKDSLLPKLDSKADDERYAKKPANAEWQIRALIEKLKQLEFIPDKEGNLCQASRYFHPDEVVFKAMQSDEDFPPVPFCTNVWLPFLERVGLIHIVTQDMFVNYAHQVEKNAARYGGCRDLEHQSETLVRHLWKREDILHGNFLDTVKSIEFIAPQKADNALCSLHPQYTMKYRNTGKASFEKFKGSIIDEGDNLQLAWTTVVILPHWAKPYSGYLVRHNLIQIVMNNLGILPHPTIEMIVSHAEQVCDTQVKLQRREKATDEVKHGCLLAMIITVFKHLEARLNEVMDRHIVRLQNLNCIPVEKGKLLVKPSQVVFEMMSHDEIELYLYKLPSEIAIFEKLCKQLEISQLATYTHYCDVLKRIHQEVGKEKMGPNEQHSSLKAFKGLISLFNEFGKGEIQSDLGKLYLPTRSGHLVISHNTIFSDNTLLELRVRNLTDLNYIISARCFPKGRPEEFQDDFKKVLSLGILKKFFKALPKGQRPDFLSHVLEEKLLESPNETSESIEIAQGISERLQNPQFQEGLLRLIRHRVDQESEDNELDEEEKEHKQTLENLGKLTIEGRHEIVTYMTYKGEKVPGSEENKSVFYTHEKDADGNFLKYTLYVVNNAKDSIWPKVCQFIDKVTGERIGGNVSFLRDMFEMNSGDICSYLDGVGILCLSSRFLDCPLPTVGDPIPIEDHHLLVQDFHSFRKGDYVGKFLMSNPVFIYLSYLWCVGTDR